MYFINPFQFDYSPMIDCQHLVAIRSACEMDKWNRRAQTVYISNVDCGTVRFFWLVQIQLNAVSQYQQWNVNLMKNSTDARAHKFVLISSSFFPSSLAVNFEKGNVLLPSIFFANFPAMSKSEIVWYEKLGHHSKNVRKLKSVGTRQYRENFYPHIEVRSVSHSC